MKYTELDTLSRVLYKVKAGELIGPQGLLLLQHVLRQQINGVGRQGYTCSASGLAQHTHIHRHTIPKVAQACTDAGWLYLTGDWTKTSRPRLIVRLPTAYGQTYMSELSQSLLEQLRCLKSLGCIKEFADGLPIVQTFIRTRLILVDGSYPTMSAVMGQLQADIGTLMFEQHNSPTEVNKAEDRTLLDTFSTEDPYYTA